MELKLDRDIDWSDLPEIESPFFAARLVEYGDPCGESIGGLGIFDWGSSLSRKDQLREIIEGLENGDIYLLRHNPTSPVFRWVNKGTDNGYWELTGSFGLSFNMSAEYMLQHIVRQHYLLQQQRYGQGNLIEEPTAPVMPARNSQPAPEKEETIDIPVAEILYQPLDNIFYLLSEEDYAAFKQEAEEFDAVIRQLESAYQSKDEKQLEAAKAGVDNQLNGLVNAQGGSSQITEVVGFRGKKFTYVRSDKMKNHRRSYKINKDLDRRSLCGSDGKLDFNKLKKQFIESSGKYSFKWDLVEPHSGSLNDWAAKFNKNARKVLWPADDPGRHFDAGAQAQLLRYSYGASLKGGFNFSDKTFGVKLEGGGDFALAEGKVSCNIYIPNAEGLNAAFDHTVQNNLRGNAGEIKHFDLGNMRARIECALYGFVGASVQASAGVYFEVDDNPGEKGKMRLRGGTKKDEGFAGVGGEAFAGAKAGGEITGNGEWQNPEKGMEWATLMSIGGAVEGAAGAAAEAKYYITYENGKFRVRAKAALVWGVGGGGEFVFSVNVDTIADFCIFVYHQLKNNDFNFLDLLSDEAFEYFELLSSHALLVGDALEATYQMGVDAFKKAAFEGQQLLTNLKNAVEDAIDNLEYAKTNQQQAEALAERILANPDRVLFLPPEGKGRLLYSLCHTHWLSFEEKQEESIIAILKTIQTWNEYMEVMEHLTEDGRRIKPKPTSGPDDTYKLGERKIWEFLDGVEKGEYLYHRLRLFMERRRSLSIEPKLHAKAIRDNGIVSA